jgi:hypothetical protein
MPHYADGTPARVGDMVQGKGYNYPEIVGTVIAVREGESCTLDVAFVTATPLPNTISHEDLWKCTGIGKQIAGSGRRSICN